MKQKISPEICKRNMKLFPLYRTLSYDFLFFYATSFLFLTQVKHISPAAIVLEDSFYALFTIILQIPAAIVVDLFGRKKSILLGNLSNVIYMILFLCSDNLFELIIAEIFSALAFSLKEVSDLSLLNSSIPPTSKKSKIFAKLSGKGLSGYFILNSISITISGFLFTINGYLPILVSLGFIIISFLISCLFVEPTQEKNIKENINKKHETNKEKAIKDLKIAISDFKTSFKFIVKSPRLRSLILYSSVMSGFICVFASFQVYLLENLGVSAITIGIIFAVLGLLSSFSSKRQDKFHNKFKNKSLTFLALGAAFSCLLAGFSGYISSNFYITLLIIVIALSIKHIIVAIYQILIDKYYRNFTNSKIDSKIFSAKAFFNSITNVISGITASILLKYTNIQVSLLVLGFIFLLLFILALIYMKKRVGLNPEQYSEHDIKFSDMISTSKN